jgi:hypothetical protein
VTTRVAVTLALSLCRSVVLGCGPSDDGVQLITGRPPQAASGCFTNSAAGLLIVDPKYGTAIRDRASGGATTTLAWRPNFSARRLGAEVEVLDPLGNVVATTGQAYRIDGGYVGGDSSWPQFPIRVFWACDRVTPQP